MTYTRHTPHHGDQVVSSDATDEVAALRAALAAHESTLTPNHAANILIDTLRLELAEAADVINTASLASLDHSCSLEGWDESCPECRAAKALSAFQKSEHGTPDRNARNATAFTPLDGTRPNAQESEQ